VPKAPWGSAAEADLRHCFGRRPGVVLRCRLAPRAHRGPCCQRV